MSVRGRTMIGVAAVVAAGAAIAAARQDRGFGFGPGPLSAVFAALDADHNNTLSPAEIAAAPAALKALDRNGDGKLALDELPMPARGGGDRGRGERGGEREGGDAQPTSPDELASVLMAFDRNGDGKLSKDELPERYQGLFTRADTNKDGFLTPQELRQSAAAQTLPPDPGRGGEGEREGERGGGREGRGGPGFRDPIWSTLDVNGDNVLSAQEMAAASANLAKLDLNHDGALTMDELMPQDRGRGRG